jgi:hypothetical protein
VKGYVRRDAGAAERGGDTGGVGGEGAVHGAELRLQRLRRAGHVRVERQVGRRRGRAQPPEPNTARGGSGSSARARPRRGGRHRLGNPRARLLGWLGQAIRVGRESVAAFSPPAQPNSRPIWSNPDRALLHPIGAAAFKTNYQTEKRHRSLNFSR